MRLAYVLIFGEPFSVESWDGNVGFSLALRIIILLFALSVDNLDSLLLVLPETFIHALPFWEYQYATLIRKEMGKATYMLSRTLMVTLKRRCVSLKQLR